MTDDRQFPPDAIAIIGMACRTPGADNVDALWDVIAEGRDCITRFALDELEDAFTSEERAVADFVASRPVLNNPGAFDAAYFSMQPREAALTDPQHRVFLEVAQSALDHAGYDPARFAGAIGVYAGCSMSTYLLHHVLADRATVEKFTSAYQLGMYSELVGALTDTLATRVAYKLDLKGPAATVQTACSTSLFAVSQAVQALQLYQCDMALAGGVSISFPQKRGYLYQDGGMASRDGTCRPFDAEASGTVFGAGAGVVLLKRLADAISDGDVIHAVVRGCGVNNDGSTKAGFTAPSAQGQAEAIRASLAAADVESDSIGYVECHGTATPLGDPIEFEGLQRAYGQEAKTRCTLGSIKANIGHLDAAAGVIGLIKAALVLRHAALPPMTHFRSPNPHIPLSQSRFVIPTSLQPWESISPRRAGVSSFGVGGTNVHVVLEEAPPPAPATVSEGAVILPFSALDEAAFARVKSKLESGIAVIADLEAAAITLQQGRRVMAHRGFVVARSPQQAAQGVAAAKAKVAGAPPRLVFVFPGQGAQRPGMARALYDRFEGFRADIDEGIAALISINGLDIAAALLNPDTDEPSTDTAIAQPALYIMEFALARLWRKLGLTPAALLGHSVGEFAAAAIADVFSFRDGLELIAARGQLMQAEPEGAMLSVRADASTLSPLLTDGVEIAAYNAPNLVVASGPIDAIAALEVRLNSEGIAHRRLATSHAFHSAMMERPAAQLQAHAAQLALRQPEIAIASTLTGAWIGPEMTDPAYWARHCRAPVRYRDALHLTSQDGAMFALEVGPGRSLSPLTAQIVPSDALAGVAPSQSGDASRDLDAFLEACGLLWTHGFELDWDALNAGRPMRRATLPGYPFAHDVHWIEPPAATASTPVTIPPDLSPSSLQPNDKHMTADHSMSPRSSQIRSTLRSILESVSGASVTPLQDDTTFLELGLDSLALGQVAAKVQTKFQFKLTFRQLLNDLPMVSALAAYIEANTAPAHSPEPARQSTSLQQPSSHDESGLVSAKVAAAGDLASVFQAQLAAVQAVIAQQNAVLAGRPQAPAETRPALPPEPVAISAEPSSRVKLYSPQAQKGSAALSPAQQGCVHDLTIRWNAKTPSSKAYAAKHRATLADPRSVSGFRAAWKEMIYPLVVREAKGSQLVDIDGNRFVDLVNGYGQTAFGHAPEFVQEALARQIRDGFAIGPQSPLAGDVAQMIADMVGLERVTFCNTGSEAVMAAMRVARCVTGRETVVVFANDYHGQFDEVLIKPRAQGAGALPIAPGIPDSAVANMVVLNYGAPESLSWIEANGSCIAAVIVEPVQSRHPELRPFDFLQSLRALTQKHSTALVFDEVVTGFRVHPGGMQAVTGIRADMATYGKVLGGGMPVGVLAGSATFMDALDGGQWRFGDDSIPEVAPTFFAGTFVRHPLVLAACKATLEHMIANGPVLQEGLAARTGELVARINADLAARGASFQAQTYSSWFMIDPAKTERFGGLLFHALRLAGLHVQEGFPCFLTTAHDSADMDVIVRAFSDSVDALQVAEVLSRAGAATSSAMIAPQPKSTAPLLAPLTPSQTEILMAAQLGPQASTAFNESIRIDLEGDLNRNALIEALNALVQRHDALRARIAPGALEMVIAPTMKLEVKITESASGANPEDAVKAAIANHARTPFDLTSGPLVRAELVELSAARHVLILAAHHIICDGWSMNVLCSDLAALYSGLVEGHAKQLASATSFASHARSVAAASAERDLEYWKRTFATLPDRVELPLDRPRKSVRGFAGATYTGFIEADLVDAARKLGARNGASLFATMLACVQALIARLSGASDVVIGAPIAAQGVDDRFDQAQAPVGHLVQFLPLRPPLNPDSPVAEHVSAVKAHLYEVLANAGCTYGAITQALGLSRDPQRPPLIDVQFNLEKLGDGVAFSGLKSSIAPNAKAAVAFDLFFNMIESTDGLRIDVDYDSDLFDAATIRRWVDSLTLLLRGFVEAPQALLGDVSIISTDERAWLLARNKEYAPVGSSKNVADCFCSIAERFGDRVALIEGDQRISYQSLDRMALQLSYALQARGVGAGDRIALVAPRGVDAIAAMLAVFRLGAVVAPMDPTHPKARLMAMREDCEAKLALIGEGVAIDAAGPGGVSLQELLEDAATHDGSPLHAEIEASAPACVMYTSGSTGRPKGAVIPHRAILRLVHQQSYANFGSDEVFLHMAPLAFDASTFEIWGALLHGGVLVSLPQTQPSLDEIENAINAHGVTTAWFTAALFHAIVDERPSVLSRLKQVLAGGDVLSPSHIARAQAAAPNARFINGYGPTENTTFTACHVIARNGIGNGAIPIGQPIGGSRVYVVDGRGRLAPRGAIGQLVVAGEGLALGYINRPVLSAERFSPCPDAGEAIVYRTGDLAQWRGDGALMFQGRSDGQVKINGMRVELGEVEAALTSSADVGEAAALVLVDNAGAKWIEAWVTPAQAGAPDLQALSATLEQRLPKAMQPRQITVAAQLPRTANGKLDRAALKSQSVRPQAATPLPSNAEPKSTALTALEAKIAAIWQDVLMRQSIRAQDALFTLGADSLHIFRIAARFAEAGIPLQARHLMANPTVAALAEMIERPSDVRDTDGPKSPVSLASFRRGAKRPK